MAENQNASTNNNPQQITEQIPVNANDSRGEDIKSDRSNDGVNTHPNYQPNIIINTPIQDNTEAVKANKISKIGIGINAILFVITLFTFWQTKRSVDIAESSLNDARLQSRKQDSMSREHDRLAEIRQRKNDSIERDRDIANRIKDSISISISKEFLEEQVKSIKESQKQFEALNDPFLQIDSVEFEIRIGQPIKAAFNVENLGKYPAMIYSANAFIQVSVSPADIGIIKRMLTPISGVGTSIPERRIMRAGYVENNYVFSEGFAKAFQKGSTSIYFFVIIRYKNRISKKYKTYTYLRKFNSDNTKNEPLINSNN